MKASEAFPSDYLKASDLKGKSATVTIDKVELVEIGKDREKETKLLITFVGKSKGLICNKTNSRTIQKVLGTEETDDWVGKRIIIEPREVEFGSEVVWAIRVSLKAPPSNTILSATSPPAHGMLGKPTNRPAEPVESQPAPVDSEPPLTDDDVPF